MPLRKRRKVSIKKSSSKTNSRGNFKKKYTKLCKKVCKKDYPVDMCDFKDNICSWYDSDYNRACNVKNFYKKVDKQDLKEGAVIKRYESKKGCSLGKETKIVRLK